MRTGRPERLEAALQISAKVPIRSRLALVGALLFTALLGSLRNQASEPGVSSESLQGLVTHADQAPYVLPVGSEEEGQLIPAVYAWDPTVRFIYYRRVTKWM